MSAAMATPQRKPIYIREVWGCNLHQEFTVIGSIIDKYPFISIDTEFPGVVVRQIDGEHYSHNFNPHNLYRFLRANVDVMKLIQVGLTFSDSDGNLPDLATPYRYIWQFNFNDFDVVTDWKAADSIDLLRKQGIDFEKNRTFGIDSVKFVELMMSSGMVCNELVSWIAFHGNYDFGLLMKILTQKCLPENLSEFMVLLKVFFGLQVYDVKCLMMHCDGLYGGLDQVAMLLGLEREVGKCHQAGSDSLLAWRVFHRMWSLYFRERGLEKYAGVLYRLETSH